MVARITDVAPPLGRLRTDALAAAPVLGSGHDWSSSFGRSTPSAEGLRPEGMQDLTHWVQDSNRRIFSLLISRHGKLAYELYTSDLTRAHSHYLMSVTKSLTSALSGIAVGRGDLPETDTPMSQVLPGHVFHGPQQQDRFDGVSLRDVLSMSALEAPDPPRDRSQQARARHTAWWEAPSRLAVSLRQPLVAEPGRSFLYSDLTPTLATAALTYARGETAYDFAQHALFQPLGFQNAEWMHEDPSGIDNGGFGLRLRPIDMQKFGNLFLRGGEWNGEQVVPREWVERSLNPLVHSNHSTGTADYGHYWWKDQFGGEEAHVAKGWKGQRIIVMPQHDLVVTTTGALVQTEGEAIRRILEDFVLPSLNEHQELDPAGDAAVLEGNERVRRTVVRVSPELENRMVPSVARKQEHRPFGG